MQKVDIVVTYLNSNDNQWQKDFNHYKNLELGNHQQNANNRQAFGTERTREWNFFRYWFRGVEKNCPWVNKVFLIVQNENHIPDWLDRKNKKLRIVYHEDFLPKELVPCFNGLTLSFYLSNIKDLSEHFIYADDDMFIVNPITQDEFFDENDNIILDVRPREYKKCTNTNDVWNIILSNNIEFLKKITNSNNCTFKYSHSIDPRSKSFEQSIIKKYENEFLEAFKVSKFRNVKNFNSYLFTDLLKVNKEPTQIKRIVNSSYTSITSKTDVFSYKDKEIVCFNDTQDLDNFDLCHKNVMSFLRYKLSSKSSFEKYDEEKPEPLKVSFGLISWLPDDLKAREQRITRMNKMFEQIKNIFGDVDWLIVAQNWKDYELPKDIKAEVFKYNKLGILGARKTLGKHFLESTYDYLIMCDDDIILETTPDFTRDYFFNELNNHPNGFMFLQYGWSLTFCAISKYIYNQSPMIDIDPEKGEGYEDTTYPWLLHYKHLDKEFKLSGIKFVQHLKENKIASTWEGNRSKNGISHSKLRALSGFYINRFKNGNFYLDKELAKKVIQKYDWYEKALFYGWCTRADYDAFMKQFRI